MVCKIKKVLLIALLLAAQSTSQELNSTLHLTAYGVQIAFVDEVVVFTCVVRGSNNMAWTSDEYIGANRQLSLVSVQPIGHEVRAVANNQTVAVLVDATIDELIISELRIRINSAFSIASVECTNVGANTRTSSSTSFHLAGAALVACDRWLVCSGESVTCSCATGNSSTHAWITNGTRLEFTTSDNPPETRCVPGSGTYAVLTESSDRNGVIISSITVSASSESDNIILTCENVDNTMTEPVIIPIDNCRVDINPTDEVTTSAGNENAPSRVTCGHPFRDRTSGDLLIIMIGYMDPAMEGATVTLVCPPQYALIGPNTTTCMGNGEWEPDPREVECKGLEEEMVEESRSANVLIVTVSSVVVAFLIISLLMFVTGFVCGHYFGRKYKQSSSSLTQPVALYEDVNVLPSAVEHQEQHLELKENVAYGPSKSTTLSIKQ